MNLTRRLHLSVAKLQSGNPSWHAARAMWTVCKPWNIDSNITTSADASLRHWRTIKLRRATTTAKSGRGGTPGTLRGFIDLSPSS